MENRVNTIQLLIANAYIKYAANLVKYVTYKIGNLCDSEDIVQDSFVRILNCSDMLREDTIEHLLYVVARNLANDYLRHLYCKQDYTAYIHFMGESMSHESEAHIYARDLACIEADKVSTLPVQRRMVYMLNRYDGLSTTEIAERMQIAKRTVDNHLRLSRIIVREYLRHCI